MKFPDSISPPANDSSPAPPSAAAFFDNVRGAFFRRVDWLAFGIVFAFAFLLYFHTLAPTVTLEDSGELVVAADYLGVPHPPGYPIWTIVAWFFQWAFHWIRYYGRPDSNWAILAHSLRDLFNAAGPGGYPNPAWAVNLCSAFFGALSCALLALLISRSGADLLRGIEAFNRGIGLRAETLFCWAGGVGGGVLLACSPVLWSQSVIAEVYSLNAFFQTLILLLLYRWMARPSDRRPLYALSFAFGLGLTNHQTLLFFGLALAAGVAVTDRALFRDCAIVGGALSLVVLLNVLAVRAGWNDVVWMAGPSAPGFWLHTLLFLIIPAIGAALLPRGRPAAAIFLLILLGLSFYAYLPLASEQNPPMNWGYPRTWSGFLHTLSRGQYERITPADVFSAKYWLQLGAFWRDLRRQFTLPIAVLGAMPFLMFRRLRPAGRGWLAATLAAFIGVSVVFLTFQNPALDITTQFIARVQFIQSHALYALWIGYGLLFGFAWLHLQTGGRRALLWPGVALALAAPAAPLWQNARDEEYLRAVGGAEQHRNDFGWQFGHWQLEGVEAIRREISPEEWAAYPTPGYPEPMAAGAILFGGTDPGRFVPTYMIFSANVRPDIYLITQNALADPDYLRAMRDLYGDRIWIPTGAESLIAFQRFQREYEARRAEGFADDTVIRGGETRMTVEGVGGVMSINAYLSRMIFFANPDREFYVEESYPIPWMMNHLEPHGLVFRLRKEPATLTDAIAARDRAFWDWYVARLVANPRFRRDINAQRSFSKLRSAQAGLYLYHRRFADAEYAYRQAMALHPGSPEAALRLADLYAQQQKYAAAAEVAAAFAALDPLNARAAEFAKLLQVAAHGVERRAELEARRAAGALSAEEWLELVELELRYRNWDAFENAFDEALRLDSRPLDYYLALGRFALEGGRYERLEKALVRALEFYPDHPDMRLDLATVRLALDRADEAAEALKEFLRRGGAAARLRLRAEERFRELLARPDLAELLNERAAP